ncbi:MAG: tRNA 2-thiouridine(34) synthase MnmA [Candidatus Limivicinus sp.]
MARILAAMSGGVDSSVAALLLLQQGHECIGCTMKLFDNRQAGLPTGRSCCTLEDVEDARSVAYRLGMPYYVFNFKDAFVEKVMGKFVAGYRAGLTPNPCIDCNRYMKFEKLMERARILGCQYIATGHYARIERRGGLYLLKKGLDESKDQSYMLYTMTQEQLAHTLFPLGGLRKAQVRQLAAENGFINAAKPDSQDICFVPDGDYAAMIERHTGLPSPAGNFIDGSGAVLGRHKGIIRYTVGQRRGLGISAREPLYVCALSAAENTVTLGSREDLFRAEADAGGFHWIAGEAPAEPFRCRVKLRYRQPEQEATVYPQGQEGVHLRFRQPQRAVTPGQAAVLYDGDTVLGGGTIL